MKIANVVTTIVLVMIINLLFYQLSNSSNTQGHGLETDRPTRHRIKVDSIEEIDMETIVAQESRHRTDSEYQARRNNAVTEAVMHTEPSVVSINVIKTQVVRRSTNPFDNPFFGFFHYRPYRREVQSIGSGFIYNEDGYIVTNAHVVEGATEIKVILNDGSQHEAEITGKDSVLDIAVLQIDHSGYLPVINLGDSEDLILGETTIAIGNPYAFLIKDSKPSVSVGVVSAINRNFSQDSGGKIYQGMVQTDAAINPGNSGGPLINILGEAIGMNTFIFSESGGSIGVGFAIPINRVKMITEEIIEYGRRRQIWFGFRIQDLNPMIASYLQLEDLNGVIVSYVDDNSPAVAAGLRRGDIIVRINQHQINNANEAEIATLEFSIGDEIELEIIRNTRGEIIRFPAVESQ